MPPAVQGSFALAFRAGGPAGRRLLGLVLAQPADRKEDASEGAERARPAFLGALTRDEKREIIHSGKEAKHASLLTSFHKLGRKRCPSFSGFDIPRDASAFRIPKV